MTDKDEQAERRAILKNDQRVARDAGGTFLQFATGEAEVVKGRTAGMNKVTVVGARMDHKAEYHNSPWAGDPTGIEPPINFLELSAVEPCGTHREVQESILALCKVSGGEGVEPATSPSNALPGDAQRSNAASPTVSSDAKPSPVFSKQKRRK